MATNTYRMSQKRGKMCVRKTAKNMNKDLDYAKEQSKMPKNRCNTTKND